MEELRGDHAAIPQISEGRRGRPADPNGGGGIPVRVINGRVGADLRKMARQCDPRGEYARRLLLPNARCIVVGTDCEGKARWGDGVIEGGIPNWDTMDGGEVGGVRMGNRRPKKKRLRAKEPNRKLVAIRRPFGEKKGHYWPQKNGIVWRKISHGGYKGIQPK